MRKSYALLLAFVSFVTFAQEISFETAEGYQQGTLNTQNGWEVTLGSDGFIQNQIVTNALASNGSFSFKNAFEPAFNEQWYPIFGASKNFETPANHQGFIISYDVLATQKLGSDFEFTLYAIDANEDFVPVAGVGIENRGLIYLIKDTNYGFDYAEAQWTPNEWVNIKIEVSRHEIKYYVNSILQKTIANFTQLDIVGFNMLHNNYGHDAYYDNLMITHTNLETKSFSSAAVSIHPNPAQNLVSIDLLANEEIAEVVFYNLSGQKVLHTNQNQNIDVSQLAKGNYFVRATTVNGSFTKKFIKN